MTYRYVKCSGQGLRFDILNPDNQRIAICWQEMDAKLIVERLNDKHKSNPTKD